MFLGALNDVTYNVHFRHQLGFPFKAYKAVANNSSKQNVLLMDQDRHKTLNSKAMIILDVHKTYLRSTFFLFPGWCEGGSKPVMITLPN